MKPQTHRRSGQIIKSYEAKALKKRSFAIRLADSLTSFFGSIHFFVINIIFFASWVLINTGKLPVVRPVDPFPFPMLTTLVSLEAIVLTIIVLMSQSRQSLISSLREELQLQVNLYSEREITKILKLLKILLEKQGYKAGDDPELTEMLKKLNASYIERKLEEQISKEPESIEKVVAEPIVKVGEKIISSERR